MGFNSKSWVVAYVDQILFLFEVCFKVQGKEELGWTLFGEEQQNTKQNDSTFQYRSLG